MGRLEELERGVGPWSSEVVVVVCSAGVYGGVGGGGCVDVAVAVVGGSMLLVPALVQ